MKVIRFVIRLLIMSPLVVFVTPIWFFLCFVFESEDDAYLLIKRIYYILWFGEKEGLKRLKNESV